MKDKKFYKFLDILRSPNTRLPLKDDGIFLVSEASDKYPIINNAAILVDKITDQHVKLPDDQLISQTIKEYQPPLQFIDNNCITLHLGSGAVPCSNENTLSLDIMPLHNVDIVASAENLPFVDNCFDYIESGAVFEHISNPFQAICEVKRTLKPGGLFRIDTAFMQSFHGFPGHYFNMTPLAVESHLVGGFELVQSCVPLSGTHLVALSDFLKRFLSELPIQQKIAVTNMKVSELLDLIDKNSHYNAIAPSSEYIRRSMAASFVVLARKPYDYNAEFEGHPILRNYYEIRMAVMLREHEIQFYKRLCSECNASYEDIPDLEVSLEVILNNSLPKSMTIADLQQSIALLNQWDQQLQDKRNQYIYRYLTAS